MEDYDPLDFLQLCEEFVRSSVELRDAAALCDGDPIKQEMIAFVVPEFDDLCARSEGIRPLVENNYLENREFIADEIKILTKQNKKIAKLIRDKLNKLAWS